MKIHSEYIKHIDYICCLIHDLGGMVTEQTKKGQVWFFHKGRRCNYWVQSEWLSGGSVKDGRGVEHLVKQLKQK